MGLGGEHEELDYSIYDGFDGSIGFTQRVCHAAVLRNTRALMASQDTLFVGPGWLRLGVGN